MLNLRIIALASTSLFGLFTAPAFAACGVSPLPAQPSEVQSFKENPDNLLQRYLSGGNGLTQETYNLTVTDPSVIEALVALIPTSNVMQKFALGTGLGDAVRQCSTSNPEVADAIQTAIAALDQPEFEVAFIQAINQVETAAVGAPGGPTPGGPLGTDATIVGRNAGGSGVNNPSINYFTGGGAGSPRNSGRSSGATAGRNPVSP